MISFNIWNINILIRSWCTEIINSNQYFDLESVCLIGQSYDLFHNDRLIITIYKKDDEVMTSPV